MTSDLDIYRSAQVLVKQHGNDAPIEAAMRADAMLEAGDLDGCAVWRRILRAVPSENPIRRGNSRVWPNRGKVGACVMPYDFCP